MVNERARLGLGFRDICGSIRDKLKATNKIKSARLPGRVE